MVTAGRASETREATSAVTGTSPDRGTLDDIREILSAKSARNLFGDNEKRARIRHRRLVASVHPDAHGDIDGAEEAMRRLNALWDEYLGRGSDGDTATQVTHEPRHPREAWRTSRYVALEEGDGWLVVDRIPTGCDKVRPLTRELTDRLAKLRELLAGSPVCTVTPSEPFLMAQPKGNHVARPCEVPDAVTSGHGAIPLMSLSTRLPGGKISPADFAWVAKRVLFLAGALATAGLAVRSHGTANGGGTGAGHGPVPDMLAISPDMHMLTLLTPWDLITGTGGIQEQRDLTIPALGELSGMLDDDTKSRKMAAFCKGIEVDRVTQSIDLMRELDGINEELFGAPRFHVMEVT